MIRLFFALAMLSPIAAVQAIADQKHEPGSSQTDSFAYLDNGIIKIGVDLERGGSIGYLAESQTGKSVINIHDFGRWVGQSYYSGPKPFGEAHPGWKNWPWNPVSAGDVYGHSSKLIEHTNDGKTLYVKSTPMQWALNHVPADCSFETWIELEGRTAHVRNRLTNQRTDTQRYRAMDQELPAVYSIGTLYRLKSYTGDKPFTDDTIIEIPNRLHERPQPKWSTFFATEHWAALVNDNDWGLGVIHPGVVRFLGGCYGKPNTGGPKDDSNGYVAPIRQEALDHNIVYEYRYSLVLDSLEAIRKEAYRLRPAISGPEYQFATDRQHWWSINVADEGMPLSGAWRLHLEQNDPQLFGPESSWQAKDVPVIYIRAAYKTKQRSGTIFWETASRSGFPVEQSVKFEVIPDGKMRSYRVDLSTSPKYRGEIRRLRFDPVDTGHPGDLVELESFSPSPRRDQP